MKYRLSTLSRATVVLRACSLGVLLGTLAGACGQQDPAGAVPAMSAFVHGQNALAEQRFDWARKHFAEALEDDPERAEALRLAGVAWLRGVNQSLAPAVDYLQRFLEQQPGHIQASQDLARCLNQLGQPEEALAVLAAVDTAALETNASTRAAVRLQQANLLLDVRPEEALGLAQRVMDEKPDDDRALAIASEAHERLGQLEAAYDLAIESLRRNPLQAQTVYRASRLLLGQGDTAEATRMVARYQLLGAVQPSQDTGAPTAIERLRRWPELAAQVDPTNTHVASLHAQLLLDAGDPSEARRALEALRASGSLTLTLRLAYASLLQRQGEVDAAEGILREGLEAEPDHRTLRYQLADLLLQRGNRDGARRLAHASQEAEPHLGRHHHLLAQIALAEGASAEARDALAEALARAPWKAAWRAQALELLWEAGERDEAEALLAAAPESDPLLGAFARKVGLAQATQGAS